MFEIIYKCLTREAWYYDSEQPTFEAAVRRAHLINQSNGRAVVVTYQDAPVYSLAQTRGGVPAPMNPALAYLD